MEEPASLTLTVTRELRLSSRSVGRDRSLEHQDPAGQDFEMIVFFEIFFFSFAEIIEKIFSPVLFVSWPVPQNVTGALFSRAANCERQSAGSRRSVHGIGRFKVLSAT